MLRHSTHLFAELLLGRKYVRDVVDGKRRHDDVQTAQMCIGSTVGGRRVLMLSHTHTHTRARTGTLNTFVARRRTRARAVGSTHCLLRNWRATPARYHASIHHIITNARTHITPTPTSIALSNNAHARLVVSGTSAAALANSAIDMMPSRSGTKRIALDTYRRPASHAHNHMYAPQGNHSPVRTIRT
jgi:hypothetical protein